MTTHHNLKIEEFIVDLRFIMDLIENDRSLSVVKSELARVKDNIGIYTGVNSWIDESFDMLPKSNTNPKSNTSYESIEKAHAKLTDALKHSK